MPRTLIPEDAWPKLEAEAVALLQELVRIPSIDPVNATTDAPKTGESAVDELIQKKLAADGIHSEILDKENRRSNIIPRLTPNGSPNPAPLPAQLHTPHAPTASHPGTNPVAPR